MLVVQRVAKEEVDDLSADGVMFRMEKSMRPPSSREHGKEVVSIDECPGQFEEITRHNHTSLSSCLSIVIFFVFNRPALSSTLFWSRNLITLM